MMTTVTAGLGDAYTDCLGACVEQAGEADPELMQQCVALCKTNFPSTGGTGVQPRDQMWRPKPTSQLIPGLKNEYLLLGGAGLLLVVLMTGRRR